MPLIPIGIGIASFLIGRLTAPHEGVFMHVLLSVLEHPVVFLSGLLLGYLLPTSPTTLAAKALSALSWLKGKL